MPYQIKKWKEGYAVTDDKGRKFSNEPISKTMATKQRIAIALSESKKTGKSPSYFFK